VLEQLPYLYIVNQRRQSGCVRLLKPAAYIKVSALSLGERRGR
jgi:hypothetical protein